jgi:hypothetical protein
MIHIGYAQSIYKKDPLTILADSLVNEDNKETLDIRKQALEKYKNTSEDHFKYLEAKYYYSQSCVYEYRSYDFHNTDPKLAISIDDREKYLDSALNVAYKSSNIYEDIKSPDKKINISC